MYFMVVLFFSAYLLSPITSQSAQFKWYEEVPLYWAEQCDWGADVNVLSKVNVPGQKCGGECVKKSGCTHFTWRSQNGGTCILKKGTASINQAVQLKDAGAVCGIMNYVPAASKECPNGWGLVKKFGFSGIDQVKNEWNVILWPKGKVNNELEAYVNSAQNLFPRKGILVVKALRKGDDYTSARIESKQGFTPLLTPGKKLRVEFTGKVPTVPGAWPAYWILGDENTNGGWATRGEIDIMEWVQSISGKYVGTIHWQDNTEETREFTQSAKEMASSFITYGVEYSSAPNDEYILYYMRRPNGQLVNATKIDKSAWSSFTGCSGGRKTGQYPCSAIAPFDNQMHLIINLAVGGAWASKGVTNFDAFNAGVEFETSNAIVCGKL